LALARALVREPKLLLLDEPLSNLDAQLRLQMRAELKRIQAERGVTTLYVTHDQGEAMAISDRIAVLQGGRLMQVGAPDQIYNRPRNEFVAAFVGQANLFRARVETIAGGGARVTTPAGALSCRLDPGSAPGAEICLMIRPEHVELGGTGEGNIFSGIVKNRTYLGEVVDYLLMLESGWMLTARARPGAVTVDEKVNVRLPSDHLVAVAPGED
jgi:iron(III) transport system ATP-binding protein